MATLRYREALNQALREELTRDESVFLMGEDIGVFNGAYKVTAGLLHGYKGEYRDKIPFNHYEIAPAIIPSVGYCWSRYCGEFVLLGGAGALFTIGLTVP